MNGELIDCKEKLLKFKKKVKQWERDMSLVVESEKTLKDQYDELENKMQKKEKELEDMIREPST